MALVSTVGYNKYTGSNLYLFAYLGMPENMNRHSPGFRDHSPAFCHNSSDTDLNCRK
jgi:hypothetical protein